MEQSHKNTDCYFFYYSTCRNGDNCPFRHEPSALGCETVCSYWKQGKCLNDQCNFRHMELKKNRKTIPCYWETQPGGCRKPHCSFMHRNARTITGEPINPVKTSDITTKPLNQEWLNRQDDTKYDGSSTESEQGRGSSEAGSFIGSPAVDPLIVKFEEESDNESVPSPVKPQPRIPYCKTYEEIRLEEIQAESAAYYSYEADDYRADVGGGKVRRVTTTRGKRKICLYPKLKSTNEEETKELDFEVLTLEEIRQRKRRKIVSENKMIALKSVESEKEVSTGEFLKNAVKTLAELKAATTRGAKRPHEDDENIATETVIRCKETGCPVKVPPVRLRRSLKRFAGMANDTEQQNTKDQNEGDGEKETNDRTNEDSVERLEDVADHKQDSRDQEDSSNSSRKNDVEIRLCDSSTNEDQAKTEEKKSVGTDTTDDSNTVRLSCDSLLNMNDDEYLMLDTASDDILKDIDALLKDKTVV